MVTHKRGGVGEGLRQRGKGRGVISSVSTKYPQQQVQQAELAPGLLLPGGKQRGAGRGQTRALLPELWFEFYMFASGLAQMLYFTGMYFNISEVPYHIHPPTLLLVVLFHCHRMLELAARKTKSTGIALYSPLTICYLVATGALSGVVVTTRTTRQSGFVLSAPVFWLGIQWIDSLLCRQIKRRGSHGHGGSGAGRGSGTRGAHKGKGKARPVSRGASMDDRTEAGAIEAASSQDYEGCILLEIKRCLYIPTLDGILTAFICIVLPVTSVRNAGLYHHAASCATVAALAATQNMLMYILQRLSWKMVWVRWANMIGYWGIVEKERIHPAYVEDILRWDHRCCYQRNCVVLHDGVYYVAIGAYNVGRPGSWVPIILRIITMKLFPAVAIITVILCSMMMVEVIGISHFAWWKPLTVNFLATTCHVFLSLYVKRQLNDSAVIPTSQ